MEDDSNPSDGSDARLPISRRAVLGGAGLLAGAAGLAATQGSSDGVMSLGGASDEQPSVPVENILVVLEQQSHDVSASAGRRYHGVDVRDGGELVFADGDELTTIPTQS